jgi:hypothetical protein
MLIMAAAVPVWAQSTDTPSPAPASSPAAKSPAKPQGNHHEEVEIALQEFGAAKTAEQRAAVVEYLHLFDTGLVTSIVTNHIIEARNGLEATKYNNLVDALKPDSYDYVVDRIESVDSPDAKAKLIVTLRHCHGERTFQVLSACLDDKRPVKFEARGPYPHRVCDLSYYVIYMKLRMDADYHFRSLAEMKAFVDGALPFKKRDDMIAKLKSQLAKKNPFTSPSPVPPKPATASSPVSMTV